MKAVRLNELGGPEKLHVEEIAEPKPAAGEVLVKVGRAAFNREPENGSTCGCDANLGLIEQPAFRPGSRLQ